MPAETVEVWKVVKFGGRWQQERVSALASMPSTVTKYPLGEEVKPPPALGPVLAFLSLKAALGFASINLNVMAECEILRCTAKRIRAAHWVAAFNPEAIHAFWRRVQDRFDGDLSAFMESDDCLAFADTGRSPDSSVWADGLVSIQAYNFAEASALLEGEADDA